MTNDTIVAISGSVGALVFVVATSAGMRIVRGLERLTNPETEAEESPVVALTDDGPQ